jgi:hypothetical protein
LDVGATPRREKGARIMDKAELFAGLEVERADALPKRASFGKEAIENPFVSVVHDSYAESLDPAVGAEKAVRAIFVPVDNTGLSYRSTKRKEKDGTETVTKWQQHPNLVTALYLLRQAADKNGCGVHIVVDYTGMEGLPENPASTEAGTTLRHLCPISKGDKKGRVRVRFVGQKKKAVKPKATDASAPGTTETADNTAAA